MQWRILYGLPITIEEYDRARTRPEPSDFARQWGSAIGFENCFARSFRKLQEGLTMFGCQILQLNCNNLHSAFDGDVEAVTIIAHWDENDRIEMFERFVPWKHVAGSVPDNYANILDLCVCKPIPLVRYVNAKKRCLVRCVPSKEATILYWMALYQTMAAIFNETPMSFDEAFIKAANILTA
jgi:hypothetical protein